VLRFLCSTARSSLSLSWARTTCAAPSSRLLQASAKRRRSATTGICWRPWRTPQPRSPRALVDSKAQILAPFLPSSADFSAPDRGVSAGCCKSTCTGNFPVGSIAKHADLLASLQVKCQFCLPPTVISLYCCTSSAVFKRGSWSAPPTRRCAMDTLTIWITWKTLALSWSARTSKEASQLLCSKGACSECHRTPACLFCLP
jgi:hypothetical protein